MSNRYNLRHSSGSVRMDTRNIDIKRKSRSKHKSPRLRKIVFVVLLVAILTVCTTLLVTGLNNSNTSPTDNKKTNQTKALKADKKEKKIKKISYQTTDNTVNIPKSIKAEYAVVIDKRNNTIVAERKAHKRTFPASTTKIMTLLVAVENMADKDDTFTMTYEITDPLFVAQASVAGFKDGEKVTMTDLMYGTILPSGADAAIGLAIKVAGSEEKFVKLMNEKVEELGLKNTHFNNVTGLHHEENYSSAYDMAIILDAALQNEQCKEVLSTYQHTTEKTKQNPQGILLSSTLFNYMYGTEPETATILGGKTGYVTEAGYCIASYGKSNDTDNPYIVVTFDSPGLWPAFYSQIDLYKQFAK